MASRVARGIILGFAGLSLVGGAAALWRSRRPLGSRAIDSEVDARAANIEASAPPGLTLDAEPQPDAAVDVDLLLASLQRRFGKSLTVFRGGPGWATVKSPNFIGLAGRSSAFGWCRETKERDNVLTVEAPPRAATDGGLPRFRNPPELAQFAVDSAKIALMSAASACPEHAHEYLKLEFACHTGGCQPLTQLRDNDAGGPKSIVLNGTLCHEQAHTPGDASDYDSKTLFVCDRIALVYDFVDDEWRQVDDPPERPDKAQDLDKDGRPEFPRTLAYVSSVDLADPATWRDPTIIDAHGFEAWDGQRWTTAAPRIQRVYGKAYAGAGKRTSALQAGYNTIDNFNCRPGDLEAIAKSTVDSYMSRDFSGYKLSDGSTYVDRSPDGDTNRISNVLTYMMPRCLVLSNLEHADFESRYLMMFEALSKAPVPPYLPPE